MRVTFDDGTKEYSIFRLVNSAGMQSDGSFPMTKQPLEQADPSRYIIIGDAFVVYFDKADAPPDKPVWGNPRFWKVVHIPTGLLVSDSLDQNNAVLCALELVLIAEWGKLTEEYFRGEHGQHLMKQARDIVLEYRNVSLQL